MASFRNLLPSIWACVFLTLVVVTVRVDGSDVFEELRNYFSPWNMFKKVIRLILPKCDEDACPGPVAHYKSLNCTPVHKDGNCCAWRYNCDHLNQKPKYKCYLNNQEYEIGERIRERDANFCEKDCICANTTSGFADFQCPTQEELCSRHVPSNTSCYMRYNLGGCCTNPTEVCLEPGDVRRTCIDEDGSMYLDGEYAVRKNHPNFICVCAGYATDQSSKFWCFSDSRLAWSDIHAATGYLKVCAPVYNLNNKDAAGLHRQTWRCPNHSDNVIRKYHSGKVNYGRDYDGEWCLFGNFSMHIGDKLNNIAYGNDSCIVCSCEVPPVPTCVIRDETFCQI